MPENYVWLEFEFHLKSGYFSLSNIILSDSKDLKVIKFAFKELVVGSNSRAAGNDVSLSIKDFSLIEEFLNDKIMIMSKLLNNNNQLIYINYSAKPPNSDATAKLTIEAEGLDINFDSIAINDLISFFLIQNVQDTVKTAAWDKFQEIQDSTQETLSDLFYKQTRFEISIQASGPRFKIPSQTGFFLLSFGELSMKNKKSNDDKYENFDITLDSLKLIYNNSDENLSIIPNFAISCTLMYLKSNIKEIK